MNSRRRIFDVGSNAPAQSESVPVRTQRRYQNFLPPASLPVSRTGVNGDAAGASFFLFLSAFGFFFSRLLLIWPFAISSSLLP